MLLLVHGVATACRHQIHRDICTCSTTVSIVYSLIFSWYTMQVGGEEKELPVAPVPFFFYQATVPTKQEKSYPDITSGLLK